MADCFDEDVIRGCSTDFDFLGSLDVSRPMSRDTLYIAGSMLQETVTWARHQGLLTNLTACEQLNLDYALEAAEGALVAGENALPGYTLPPQGVSGAAAKLKFKNHHSQGTPATGPMTNHSPTSPGSSNRHRSASAPPSPTFNTTSSAASQTGAKFARRPRARADPTSQTPQTTGPIPPWRRPSLDIGHIRNLTGPEIIVALGDALGVGAASLSPNSNPAPPWLYQPTAEDLEDEL